MSFYSSRNISIIPPTGSITAYLGSVDPPGWVICDGLTRTATDGRFAGLLIIVGTGTSNSYTPPDYRGAFLRGSNQGTSNTVATTTYGALAPALKGQQGHMTETHSHTATLDQGGGHNHSNVATAVDGIHNHTATITSGGSHTHSFDSNPDGAHTHTFKDRIFVELEAGIPNNNLTGKSGGDNDNSSIYVGTGESTRNQSANHTHTLANVSNNSVNHTHPFAMSSGGTHTHSYTTSNSSSHTHTVSVNVSTTNAGSETIPHNYGVNWILKL